MLVQSKLHWQHQVAVFFDNSRMNMFMNLGGEKSFEDSHENVVMI